ncbi:MAG TPA: FAD-binding oxidoreductase [Phenylobacterium sp.]|nr:FAD-binding oxidoreductase [Phenylobacterium sp.]
MNFDVIVIGAGAAGAAAAYELAREGRVCILEREPLPGVHATGRSAALFAPSYGGTEVRALTRASRSFFETPPEGFTSVRLLTPRGCLYVARNDQAERLAAMVESVRRSGGSLVEATAAEARACVPLLRPGYVAAAALDRGAMDIDVDALHQGFLRGARALGAVLRTSVEIRHAQWREGGWRLELDGDEVSAPVVINAAGAWADEVAQLFGAAQLGLVPMRRTALVVEAPAGIDVRAWPTVMDADENFYCKPDTGQLLLSPADETPDVPGDAQATELDVAIGVDRVQAALDLPVRQIRRSWAGLRTFAPDRIPVLGFDPATPGFFWCVGQGGYGIQTAPAMGRATAALATGRTLPADIQHEGLEATSLSPERFARPAG